MSSWWRWPRKLNKIGRSEVADKTFWCSYSDCLLDEIVISLSFVYKFITYAVNAVFAFELFMETGLVQIHGSVYHM